MRVAMFTAMLAFIIVMVTLAVSAYTIGNLGNYVSAKVYMKDNTYYLTINMSNPLPTPIIVTVSQDNVSSSVSIAPYGYGSVDIQLISLTTPINVTIAIPGIANVTSTVTINES